MTVRFCSLILISALLAACNTGPKSSHGFTLPDGDATAGKAVFTAMSCNGCHSVAGMPELREGFDPELKVELGGKTTRIKTYGELVTSIINPSHKLSPRYPLGDVSIDGVSKMTSYNDVLTVSELIDLVAFLQAQYELQLPPRSTYPPYTY